ncbi:MAG: hypothetical protein V3S55_09705 [Nitrospiraceae bacterium]
MTDPFRAYIEASERHAAAIARDSGLIPFSTYKCCICEPSVFVDLAARAKHDAAHHRMAKRTVNRWKNYAKRHTAKSQADLVRKVHRIQPTMMWSPP